ncbi:MAG: DNA polymerase III subunit beta [Omnitrophica bacterium RBG_13_46_9]|nr:MAG: DNA polymerase III subunit beta [Omnitrophica bacterium RBG_13_46_9]
MKFVTTKDQITKTLQKVQNAVSSKTTLPILSNMLLETYKDLVKITATDLDMGISSTTPIKSEVEGAVTLPAKKFLDIMKELPDKCDISISTKKNNIITIECDKIVFKIIGLPKEEFPQPPNFTDKDMLTLPQKFVKDMIVMTSFAVSHDETRYVLNGVLCEIKNKSIKLVATDGRRLAVIEKELPTQPIPEKKIIIPSKTVQELSRLLQDEGEVKISFDENQILFDLKDTLIISRLIEGEFPNYEQVIPKETKEKIIVDRDALLSATKRASLLVNPDSMTVKFDISKNKMSISKNTPYMGEVREELGVLYKGKDISVGFNPYYIIEVLKNIEAKDVSLELADSDKPGVIRLGNEYTYVVLPMQIA